MKPVKNAYTNPTNKKAEHGPNLLRDHPPSSDPPRHLHQRQGPDQRDRNLHRRMERALPTIHLDQNRRPAHPARHERSTNFNTATLGRPTGRLIAASSRAELGGELGGELTGTTNGHRRYVA